MRLLVQPALKPIAIENQVLSICAGVYGFLDRIDVSDIAKYEQELISFVETTVCLMRNRFSIWVKI